MKKNIKASFAAGQETQLTHSPNGHALLNRNIFSPDSNWIVYDVRSQDSIFDGDRIEKVQVHTKEVITLYKAPNQAKVGAVNYHPFENKAAFIHGPEFPCAAYDYSATHRYGAIIDEAHPQTIQTIDARNVIAPFTPGALRGGSHVHVWHPDATMLSFTYEDDVLSNIKEETTEQDMNIRNIGVTSFRKKVNCPKGDHNLSGFFTILASKTNANAKPGSDEIIKALEEGWIGSNGYLREDGTRQTKALAFQGIVLDKKGQEITEVYRLDLPEDLTIPGESGPLEGTLTKRPQPPKGTKQTRLTFTNERKYPGIQGPRHWLRSSQDGSEIAYMAKDDEGIVQIWIVPTIGGTPTQVTQNSFSIQTSFDWSPDGKFFAYAADNSLFITEIATGISTRLTEKSRDEDAILPYWVCYSPNGKSLAYLRNAVASTGSAQRYPQIFAFHFA